MVKHPTKNKFRKVRTQKKGSMNYFASFSNTEDVLSPIPAKFFIR